MTRSKHPKLVESNISGPDVSPPAAGSCQENSDEPSIVDSKENVLTNTSSSNKTSDQMNFHRLMTGTSSQEFFEALDGASAEELDTLLSTVEVKSHKVSLADKIEKHWQHLMTVPPEPRNFRSVLGWWESRRAFYNAVVGSIGLFMASLVCWHYQLPLVFWGWALGVCVVYAVVANLCYSLGAPSELIVRCLHKFDRYGPILFTLGLAFSIVVVVAEGMSLLAGLPGLQG